LKLTRAHRPRYNYNELQKITKILNTLFGNKTDSWGKSKLLLNPRIFFKAMNNLNVEYLNEENIYDGEAQVKEQCLCTKEVKKLGNLVHCLLHIILSIIQIWYGIKFKSFTFENPMSLTNLHTRHSSIPKIQPLHKKPNGKYSTKARHEKPEKESLFMLRNLSQQELESYAK
jgi:hypothetical protein